MDALSCGTCILFFIGTRIMAFSIAISVSVTTTLIALLWEGGALRMCHSCDQSFAIIVQKMQSLLEVLGIMIVSGGEIVLQTHPEVTVSRSTLTKEGI
jgi:hypothetical protein